jgi:hypothetical protein
MGCGEKCPEENWLDSSSSRAHAKKPPRIAAGGFWAKQITLIKTHRFTGPVNQVSIYLSTAGGRDLAACDGFREELNPSCARPVGSSVASTVGVRTSLVCERHCPRRGRSPLYYPALGLGLERNTMADWPAAAPPDHGARLFRGDGRKTSAQRFGSDRGTSMTTTTRACVIAAVLSASFLSATSVTAAKASSAYDGAWSLSFVTQRGDCNPTYNFDVNISRGFVSHPNLVRFRGNVTARGLVHASVTVQDKHADGSGRLTNSSGRGIWRGYEGTSQCSGYWTAQRTY